MSTTQKKYKDEDWLRTEYVEKGRSSTDIADELSVSANSVCRWLEKHNIERRKQYEIQTDGDTEKLRDQAWLEEQYIDKEKSSTDIADELDCSHTTVLNWLDKFNIEIRDGYETRTNGNVDKLRDKQWLIEQYVEKGRSSNKIRKEVNCDKSTVLYWLDKHNIESRDSVEAQTDGSVDKLRDKEWLVEQYVKRGKSSDEISKEVNVDSSTVLTWLKKCGIETREPYETRTNGDTNKLRDKEWLIEQYVKNKRTSEGIADELGCSQTSVVRWLCEHDIEVKSWYDYCLSGDDVPDYIDHKIRSSWELEVAEMLIDNDVDYEYESMEIEYGDRTYIPDFITDDYIIEVKGWVRGNDERQKAETTMEKIDDKEYVVVGSALPCDIHIDWENNSELVELFT